MSQKPKCQIAKRIAILLAIALTSCDSGWTGAHKEAGPLPLSSPDMPIVRLVNKRRTFEQGEIKRLLWDEGKGPILAEDRIKTLLASIPKELSDRLHSTRDVPAKLYAPFTDKGTTYEYIYDTWLMVVSLNPDVLIASVHEPPVGPHSRLPPNWDRLLIDQTRREYLDGQVEFITGGVEFRVYAGTHIPWSKEMYVFSTDLKVESGPLKFENSGATIPLPTGKLVLRRDDNDDVDVRRE